MALSRFSLRPFGFLAPKGFNIIWLSNLLTITVLDKRISENRSAHEIDILFFFRIGLTIAENGETINDQLVLCYFSTCRYNSSSPHTKQEANMQRVDYYTP